MTTIQVRRGTSAQATSDNPTLAQGEIGFETDTGKFKIGDGATAWTALAYATDLTRLPASVQSAAAEAVLDSNESGPVAINSTGISADERIAYDMASAKIKPVASRSVIGVQQVNAVRLRLFRASKVMANRWDTMDLVRLLGLPNQNTGTVTLTANSEAATLGATGPANGDFIMTTSTSGFEPGTIPEGTTVASGGGTTSITLSQNAAAAGSSLAYASATNPVYQLREHGIYAPQTIITYASGTLTYTGSGWANVNGNAAAYPYTASGGYARDATAGDSVSCTTPAGVDTIVVRGCIVSNGGVAVAYIDGDPTKAVRLPTAQTLVTQGYLPSSALAANGGPLQPTWRCILQCVGASYGPDYDVSWCLTDSGDISAGSHTVELMVTSVVPTGSSGTRLYLTAMSFGGPAILRGTPGVSMLPVHNISKGASAHEPPEQLALTQGGANTLTGRVHGYETQQSFTVNVDGCTFDSTVGNLWWGDQVTLEQYTTRTHPTIGSGAAVVNCHTIYKLDADGLRFITKRLFNYACYAAGLYSNLLPVDGKGGAFQQGQVGSGSLLDLDNYNDSFYGSLSAAYATITDTLKNVYAQILLTDPALTNNYVGGLTDIQDRNAANGYLHKAYTWHWDGNIQSSNLAISAGSLVWDDARYTADYV